MDKEKVNETKRKEDRVTIISKELKRYLKELGICEEKDKDNLNRGNKDDHKR